MGSLTPVITGLTTITTAISAADRLINVTQDFGRNPYKEQQKALRAEQEMVLRQLTARQAAEEQQALAEARIQKDKIAADAQANEQKRRAALRRAVARQRVAFGGSGFSGGDGSSEAVLLGLFEESEQDKAASMRLDSLRNAALDQSLDEKRTLNVLQRSQLQERQALERFASA